MEVQNSGVKVNVN